MGFLLDTSVLSTFAPDRPAHTSAFRRWLKSEGRMETWYVPTIAAVEIQKGVAKLRRLGSEAKAERLEQWLTDMLHQFDRRILSVTAPVARRAGNLEDAALAGGRNPGLADILIAATAQEHELTVLTSNTRHFEILNTPHFDPFAAVND